MPFYPLFGRNSAYSILGKVVRPEGFAYSVLGGNDSTSTPHHCPPAEAAHPFGRTTWHKPKPCENGSPLRTETFV